MQEFEANGNHNLDKARTSGSLKTKLKCSAYGKLCYLECINIVFFDYNVGFTFTETWNTNSELDAELTFEPEVMFFISNQCIYVYMILQKVEGLKFTLSSEWFPTSG